MILLFKVGGKYTMLNKTYIKKGVTLLGITLLLFNFILYIIEFGDIFEASLNAIFSLAFGSVYFDGLQSYLTLLSIICLITGLFMQKKYKSLRFIGYFPFIILLCMCILFLSNITLLISLTCTFFWPYYIVGVILIVVSSIKLKQTKNNDNSN